MRRRIEPGAWVIGGLTSLAAVMALVGAAVLLGFIDPSALYKQQRAAVTSSSKVAANSATSAQAPTKTEEFRPPRSVARKTVKRAEHDRADARTAVTIPGRNTPEPAHSVLQNAQSAPTSVLQSDATVPGLKVLTPVGYVEKSDGVVEAVISDPYGVQLVRVGDRLGDDYRVASVAKDSVELVAIGGKAASAENTVLAGLGPDAFQKPAKAGDDQTVAWPSIPTAGAPGKNSVSLPTQGADVAVVKPNGELQASSAAPSVAINPTNASAAVQTLPTLAGVNGAPEEDFNSIQKVESRGLDAISAVSDEVSARPERALAARRDREAVRYPGQESTSVRENDGFIPEAESRHAESEFSKLVSSGVDPPVPAIPERGPPATAPAEAIRPPPATEKPIGYVEWENGDVLAAINDGEGGVRLVHERELVAGRGTVASIEPDEIEFAGPRFAMDPVARSRSAEYAAVEVADEHPIREAPATTEQIPAASEAGSRLTPAELESDCQSIANQPDTTAADPVPPPSPPLRKSAVDPGEPTSPTFLIRYPGLFFGTFWDNPLTASMAFDQGADSPASVISNTGNPDLVAAQSASEPQIEPPTGKAPAFGSPCHPLSPQPVLTH